MRVEDKSTLKGADSAPAKSAGERSAIRPQTDKVSLDGTKQVQAVVQAVQPDAGQLAEKIVQAAEVDAHLRAVFGG